MKKSKCGIAILLIMMMAALSLSVWAAPAGKIDTQREVELTVAVLDGETPLVSVPVDIYLVATVDENITLTATDTFAKYNVNIQAKSDAEWKTLASTLEGYVLRDKISSTGSGKTDDSGKLTFSIGQAKLSQGLYLVLCQDHTQDKKNYEAAPAMVLLPGQDATGSEWQYEGTINPKLTSTSIPDQPTTVTRKVLKVWEDEGHTKKRPAEITVQLLCDGEVYEEVALNQEINWHYTWDELESGHKWKLVEKDQLENYKVAVTKEGVTFVVTNTYKDDTPATPGTPGTPTSPRLPQTGQLWWPVPLLLACGLLLIVFGLVRRRGKKNEA